MTGSILKEVTVIWQQLQKHSGEHASLLAWECSSGLLIYVKFGVLFNCLAATSLHGMIDKATK